MAKERVRRLAAVWFADIVGYTRLSASHEDAALAVVDEFQAASRRVVEAHGGRVVKFVGDAVLVVFESADAALKAALALRAAFHEAPTAHEYGCELTFGIHLGEVVEAEDGDVYGDGVNVASRVQGKAVAGQILATRSVVDLIRGRPEFQLQQLPPWIRLKGLGFAQLFNISGAGERPPPRRVTVSRATAVGMTAGLVAFIGLVVGQGFGGGDDGGDPPGDPGAGVPVRVPTVEEREAIDAEAAMELDAGTDAYFAGEWGRAARRLGAFTQAPLRTATQAEVGLRYLARTELAQQNMDGVRRAVEGLVSVEPPMRLLLPNVDSDSMLDVYYEVRTDTRRTPAGTPVVGIIVFDLHLASDVDDPALDGLGSQVSQMLVSELGGSGGSGAHPWEVRYPWDGLAEYSGERAYEYFQDRVLMSETTPATHALFGRLAIRDGQLSLFARVYELATGGVVASGSETGVWPDHLFDAVEALGTSLADGLSRNP